MSRLRYNFIKLSYNIYYTILISNSRYIYVPVPILGMIMIRNNKKMTSMTRTILFAGLIMTLMVPVAGMNVVKADVETSEKYHQGKTHIKLESSDSLIPIDSERLRQINQALNDDGISQEEIDALQEEIQEMEINLKAWFAENLDPVKESEAREKQKLLTDIMSYDSGKNKAKQKILNSIPITAIGYDYVDNALEISIDPEKFNTPNVRGYVEKIRSIVGAVDLTISPEFPATPTACSNRTSFCDEPEGGMQFGLSGCSIMFAGNYDNKDGFVTAGHCLQAFPTDVTMPRFNGEVIGAIEEEWYDLTGSITCDCGFVSIDDDVVEMSDNIFGTINPNSVYTESGGDGVVNVGTSVTMSGVTSNVQVGFVTGVDKLIDYEDAGPMVTGVVQASYFAATFDSGAPVITSNTAKLAGMHIAIGENSSGSWATSYFIPESTIKSTITGLTWGF